MALLKAKEVADFMRVSVQTVRALVKAGKLPTVQAGKQIRVDAQDLVRYMRGITPSPKAASTE